jgi:regulator of sigma E protease
METLAMIIWEVIRKFGVFIIFLGILVTVHEWGHFITAKRLGVDVERFSFGFGPKLFSRMHRGTEFVICLFPLGGYVKMAGDERDQCQGKPGEFFSKPVGYRALIVVNGPLINFLLAYVALVIVFLLGYPDLSTNIHEVINGKPAQMAGLRSGDEVVAVNRVPVYGWSELQKAIAGSQGDQIVLRVNRANEMVDVPIVPEMVVRQNLLGQEEKVRGVGISPYGNVIGEVEKDSPADKAGIKKGDKIISIDGATVLGWTSLATAIMESKSDTIEIVLERENQMIHQSVAPKTEKVKNRDKSLKELRTIGIGPVQDLDSYRFGLGSSLVRGFQKFIEFTALTYKAIFLMIVGNVSAKESVAGPIGIFNIVDAAAQMGLNHFLLILAVISANLAIVNLFPIVPLDGGHLLIMAMEKIRGGMLPRRIEETFARIGFSLIILLTVFVFYVDFARMGWIDQMFNFAYQIKQLF